MGVVGYHMYIRTIMIIEYIIKLQGTFEYRHAWVNRPKSTEWISGAHGNVANMIIIVIAIISWHALSICVEMRIYCI